jgi:hypothetical protein
VDSDAVMRRWEREQALLGLARDTPVGTFAAGGLRVLAVEPRCGSRSFRAIRLLSLSARLSPRQWSRR